MDVVLVSSQRGWRGGEEQARILLRGLAERGHRCRALAFGGEVARRLVSDGIACTHLRGSPSNPRALLRLRGHLQRLAPDVLHANDPNAATAAGLASIGLPIRARLASRRVAFKLRSPWIYARFFDRVVCVSSAVETQCRTAGLDRLRTCVVHDGVDPARALGGDGTELRARLALPTDARIILCVASLVRDKGHATLLRAFARIAARNRAVHLLVAGDGGEREPLQRSCAAAGIVDRVHFLGHRDDVADLYAAAHVFALVPCSEGLCSSVLEAAYAALPIVTSDLPSIRESVGPTPDAPAVARLVAPDDELGLADALEEVLRDPARARRLGISAHRRVARRFAADAMVQASEAAYLTAMAAQERARPRAVS